MLMFGGYCAAQHTDSGEVQAIPLVVAANTRVEALGFALNHAREKLPASLGWGQHTADVVQARQETINKCIKLNQS